MINSDFTIVILKHPIKMEAPIFIDVPHKRIYIYNLHRSGHVSSKVIMDYRIPWIEILWLYAYATHGKNIFLLSSMREQMQFMYVSMNSTCRIVTSALTIGNRYMISSYSVIKVVDNYWRRRLDPPVDNDASVDIIYVKCYDVCDTDDLFKVIDFRIIWI